MPSRWKAAFISPIHKKGSKDCVEHYRPISKLCLLSKILERIIYTQLYSALKHTFSPAQHGFLKQRSTVSNLLIFSDFVTSNMDNGDQVDAIYTDYSKAFDRIDHCLLLNKLHLAGIRDDMKVFMVVNNAADALCLQEDLCRLDRYCRRKMNGIKEKEKIANSATLDEAMLLTGFGLYNITNMLLSGLILMGMIMETLGLSYVIPAAQCDLDLSLAQKGWLAAIPFVEDQNTTNKKCKQYDLDLSLAQKGWLVAIPFVATKCGQAVVTCELCDSGFLQLRCGSDKMSMWLRCRCHCDVVTTSSCAVNTENRLPRCRRRVAALPLRCGCVVVAMWLRCGRITQVVDDNGKMWHV
ncbi:unnamed protein product [Plutella xylostella]|uniref:(diamondback moth) hypothetical protein n=1 Tax=Plutella xylostella TaxID=51655 RepID=A0A8S4EY30_PLUXY|nr:unnamed protein product [Plutella xylostella]